MKLRTLRNVFGLAALGWIFGNGMAYAQTDLTWRGENGSPADAWGSGLNWIRTTGSGAWIPTPPTAGVL